VSPSENKFLSRELYDTRDRVTRERVFSLFSSLNKQQRFQLVLDRAYTYLRLVIVPSIINIETLLNFEIRIVSRSFQVGRPIGL